MCLASRFPGSIQHIKPFESTTPKNPHLLTNQSKMDKRRTLKATYTPPLLRLPRELHFQIFESLDCCSDLFSFQRAHLTLRRLFNTYETSLICSTVAPIARRKGLQSRYALDILEILRAESVEGRIGNNRVLHSTLCQRLSLLARLSAPASSRLNFVDYLILEVIERDVVAKNTQAVIKNWHVAYSTLQPQSRWDLNVSPIPAEMPTSTEQKGLQRAVLNRFRMSQYRYTVLSPRREDWIRRKTLGRDEKGRVIARKFQHSSADEPHSASAFLDYKAVLQELNIKEHMQVVAALWLYASHPPATRSGYYRGGVRDIGYLPIDRMYCLRLEQSLYDRLLVAENMNYTYWPYWSADALKYAIVQSLWESGNIRLCMQLLGNMDSFGASSIAGLWRFSEGRFMEAVSYIDVIGKDGKVEREERLLCIPNSTDFGGDRVYGFEGTHCIYLRF
ncbi:hypothetical protein BJ508DRAFT_45079 [Ascobolus immersus RN42]|uniref:F-box domain-containing protein n=1 Tax=Ascobolus immersus RN42 TaxID=1160509 RepID=A0A3N4HIT7_ASCIM|nr:hypothetical protein BJ508DRAFT_45079 [Ascobolus immersus RN42]